MEPQFFRDEVVTGAAQQLPRQWGSGCLGSIEGSLHGSIEESPYGSIEPAQLSGWFWARRALDIYRPALVLTLIIGFYLNRSMQAV